MSNHPANLILRLLLQIGGLIAVAQWGWVQHTAPLRYVLVIAAPLVLAGLWLIFDVRNDPTRSRQPLVAIPGGARLTLELGCFGLAVWSMIDGQRIFLAIVFIIVVLLHYFWSADRVVWLLRS